MLTTIEGYRCNNIELYWTLRDAIEFYGVKLLGKRMAKNVYVYVKLTRELKKKEGAYGFCMFTDNPSRPREFEIELDTSMKYSFEQILTWLAHEMVHMKQWVRHELIDYDYGQTQWKSRRYTLKHICYNEEPWEKEAYRLEDKLYEKFAESYYE